MPCKFEPVTERPCFAVCCPSPNTELGRGWTEATHRPRSALELPRTQPVEEPLRMRGGPMASTHLCTRQVQPGGGPEEPDHSLWDRPSGSVWPGALFGINVSSPETSGSNWAFSSSWDTRRSSFHKCRARKSQQNPPRPVPAGRFCSSLPVDWCAHVPGKDSAW